MNSFNLKAQIINLLLCALFMICIVSCKEKAQVSDAFGNFEVSPTTVSSEVSGQLIFLSLEEGQVLSNGKLVALVDTSLLDLQRKQIQASIQILPKKLRNTLADIEVLKEQKVNLIRERDRVERLIEKKAATPKQLDDINGQIELVDKQIIALRSQTNTNNQAILSEKEPLMAQIKIIEEKIKKSYIYNPITGTVLTKLTEPHEIVGMGSPLYRIGNLDTMTLRFYADAAQLQRVKLSDKVKILVDQGKENWSEFEGRISWISEQAEFTPKTIQTKEDRVNLVYAMKARVPNPNGYLKIGMPAEVKFNKNTTENPE